MSVSILIAVDSPVSPEASRWLARVAVEHPVLELRPDYAALIMGKSPDYPGAGD